MTNILSGITVALLLFLQGIGGTAGIGGKGGIGGGVGAGCPGTAPPAASAFWPLGGNPTGTITSSSTVPDDSGSGFGMFWQGTTSGSTPWWYSTSCPGSITICGNFNGTDNWIGFATTAPNPTSVISIFARFKTSGPGSGAGGGFQAIVRKEGAFTIGLTSGSSCQPLFGIFAGSNATYSTNLCDGGWHDMLATYDGATMTIYMDAVSVATQSNTNAIPSVADSHMAIGGSTSFGNQLFNGTLSHIAIWSTTSLTLSNATYIHSCAASTY